VVSIELCLPQSVVKSLSLVPYFETDGVISHKNPVLVVIDQPVDTGILLNVLLGLAFVHKFVFLMVSNLTKGLSSVDFALEIKVIGLHLEGLSFGVGVGLDLAVELHLGEVVVHLEV
jgi:hypothetical protein